MSKIGTKKKNNLQPGEVKRRTRAQEILVQYRRNKGAMVSLIILLVMLVILVFAQFYYDFETDICQVTTNVLAKPSWEHPFGTDHLGRDVFARLLYGGRWYLLLAACSTIISVGLGTLYGAIATYIGGRVENIMFRIVDAIMMIPSLLMVIVLIIALGPSTPNLILAMSIGGMPHSARLARSTILPIRDSDYVESARAIGVSGTRILFSHVLPNSVSPLIVSATMRLGNNIIHVATYSFLGLGVAKPIPEWGTMLSEARDFLFVRPELIFYPGIMILIFTLLFNLIGDGLRDALDPKMKR